METGCRSIPCRSAAAATSRSSSGTTNRPSTCMPESFSATSIQRARGTVKLAGDGLRAGGGAGHRAGMTPAARSPYAGHRFPPEVISHAVWLYFRFPLALRMVEELLAARGITVSHETVRQWALKF